MIKRLSRALLVRATVIATLATLGSPALAVATHGAPADCPTVAVSGSGEASAVADIARSSLVVETTAPDAATAMADNATATRHVIDALIAADVAAEDIQTGGLSLDAVYDFSTSPNTIAGYRAAQQLDVMLRDLTEAGAALDAAAAAGQNAVRINGISFAVSDNKALLAAAREAAVADARTKGDHYAQLTGSTLGRVLSIAEHPASPTFFPAAPIDSAGAPGLPTPIRPADVGVFVTVDIVWELVQGQTA